MAAAATPVVGKAKTTHQFSAFSALIVGIESESCFIIALQQHHSGRRPTISVGKKSHNKHKSCPLNSQ